MLAELVPLETVQTLLTDVQSDRLLSIQQTASYLEVEVDDLKGWIDEQLIPCYHVGDQLVFRLREVVLWEVRGRLQLVSEEASR